MKPELIARLVALNSEFYHEFALSFAHTRGENQAGILPTFKFLPPKPSVLDLGCGNGRLARLLASQRETLFYVGLDFSTALLDVATRTTDALENVTAQFVQANVTRPGWEKQLSVTDFDAVFALALLHHVPGFEQRVNLLRAAANLLAASGVLAVSFWQLLDQPRLRARRLLWKTVGVNSADVDEADVLLDWRRDGLGLRYCRHIDAAEAHALIDRAGLRVVDSYYADGYQERANFFCVCRPA